MTDADESLANLSVFYQTMTTEELDHYRTALWLAREEARRTASSDSDLIERYCTARLACVYAVLLARGERYRIDDGRRITCLTCGLTSQNPHDVEQRYCGSCHRWHDEPEPAA